MHKLSGKVVLITGGARRIGAATARMLHQQGANIVLHYRNSISDAENLNESLNKIRPESCFLQQAELSDVNSLECMVSSIIQRYGRLDVLINNASSFFPTKLGEITEEQWDNLLASNLKAPLFLSQAAAPNLSKNQGSIINMVDIHAERPLAEHPVYCAVKSGLLMLTKSLAKELGPEVRVNGVSPGAILWPEGENNEEDSKEHQKLIEKTSLKRMGCPEDIAKTILFLIADAPYITGHILPVDGGRLLNQ